MAITGIIRPPPEIRAVADKTAAYVAKNGRAFETKIMNSERGKTPKFAFLHQSSPFHAYYEDRIQFYANGGTDDEKKEDAGTDKLQLTKGKGEDSTPRASTAVVVKKKAKTQKASAIDPIAKALLAQRSKIMEAKARLEKEREKEKNEDGMNTATSRTITFDMALPPPSPLELATIVAPFNLTQTQIETIQLVAQFTAMDGKGGPFLHQLTLREWSNPEFSFCQPRHPHFAYFSALVDAYRRILRQWIQAAGSDATVAKEETKESCETKSLEVLEEAAFRAEYEREMKLQMSQQQQEEGEISAIDWNDFVVVETIDFPADEMVEAMLPPPASALEVVGNPSAAVGLPKRTEDVMDESSDEEDQGETIRVVPSYTPKVVGASDLSSARVIDPITGKSVAVADMPEHMRIQLLDPKWAEERRKFQEKQKDSNLVSGDAIVANISRLAQSREKVVAASKPAGSAATQAKRPMELPPVTTANPAVAAGTASAPSHLAEPMAKRPRLDMPPAMAAPPPPSAAVPTDSVPEAFEETTLEEEKKLLSEEEFAASLRSPDVTLQIRVPSDSAQMAWNFYGQMVTLSVNVMTTVKDVKAQLSKKHLNDMPANKILLKDPKGGFLSNNATLASLNIGPTATLEMSLKQRGGRK